MNIRDLVAQAKTEEYLAVEVIARALQVSRRKLMRHMKRKQIPFVQVGRSVRIHADVFLKTFAANTFPATSHHSGHSGPNSV